MTLLPYLALAAVAALLTLILAGLSVGLNINRHRAVTTSARLAPTEVAGCLGHPPTIWLTDYG